MPHGTQRDLHAADEGGHPMMITNLQDLCDYFDVDRPSSLNRRIYNDTRCGASMSIQDSQGTWHHNRGNNASWNNIQSIIAFSVQTIVEGSDAEVNCDPFILPVDSAQVDAAIAWMEAEADRLWNAANQGNENVVLTRDYEEIDSTDYTLHGGSCWITVDMFSLYIHRTTTGVTIEVWPSDRTASKPVTSMHVLGDSVKKGQP